MNREEIWEKAKRVATDNKKLGRLISDALKKMETVAGSSETLSDFLFRIKILIRMVKVHVSGSYPSFSVKTILLTTFTLLYFIIPTDVIPDFIPVLGFTDDISILYFIWKLIDQDVAKFLQWERLE